MSSRFSREWRKGKPSRNVEDRRFGRARQANDYQLVQGAGSAAIPGTLGEAVRRVDRAMERRKGMYRENRSSPWREVFYGN